MDSINEGIEYPDSNSVVIYLDCPGSQVVLLQAFFDLYEGIGVVRTLDIKRSRICIITTPDMLQSCVDVLRSIQDTIPWRYSSVPSGEMKELYLGYGKKGL